MARSPTVSGRRPLPIAAVSDLLEIPIPTIRSWERRYGFPSPTRTDGRHRRYEQVEIDQLRGVRDAIMQGYGAREAVALVREGRSHGASAIPYVEALLRSAMDLDPSASRAVLLESADDLGVEGAIVRVAIPAMQEVGSRWRAGACDAANEHEMTEVVRRWLARELALADPPTRPRPVVLACGPKELHCVGLEAFAVILARRGWPLIVLGALTPVASLRKAVQDADAAAAVVVAQRGLNRRSTAEALRAIRPLLGRASCYAGGAFATPAARKDVSGTYLGPDLIEASTILASVAEASRIGSG